MLLLIVTRDAGRSVYNVRQGSWHGLAYLCPDNIFTVEKGATDLARREGGTVYRMPDTLSAMEPIFCAERKES